MPVDASIYSLIRQPQQGPGPLDQFGQVMQLKALMGQQELQGMQRDQLRRSVEEEAATSDAYREAGGDISRVRELLYGKGLYKPALAVEKTMREKEKSEAEARKLKIETHLKSTEGMRDYIATLNPQTYNPAQVREVGAQLFGPDMAARMNVPETFDPAWQQQQVVTAKELITNLENARNRAVTTRGQDVSAETARRGQDFTRQSAIEGHEVTRRGQNMVDTRARDTANRADTQYDPDRGIMVNRRTSTAAPVTQGGAPIGPKSDNKDLTDAQAKALLFSNRMAESDKIIAGLAAKGTNTSIPGSRSQTLGPSINVMSSPDQQKLDQAKRDFVNAVLRRESGAVISDQEFDNAEKQYFPQVGDSKAVMEQKARNRAVAISGIQAEVPAAKRGAGLPPPPAAPRPRAQNPQTGAIVEYDGKAWVPVSQ